MTKFMKNQDMDGKKQTFIIPAPEAHSVLLAGDFTHWQNWAIPMRRQRGGLWKATVQLFPGTYHYRFIVDGQWRDDPQSNCHVPNPYGGRDSIREVD